MNMAVVATPGRFQSPVDQISNSMSEAGEGQAVVNIPVARPGMGSLCIMMDFVIQKSYTDLQRLAELLPSKTDMDKKISIAEYLNRTRLLFSRLLALVRVASTSSKKVEKSYDIMDFLEEQKFYLIDVANNLTFTAREILVNSRLPNFCVTLAVDIMTNKHYSRLPSCLKDKIVPASKTPKCEWLKMIPELNKIIYTRLTASQIPPQMRLLTVGNGYVTFIVPGEFKIRMTLMSMHPQHPWRILGIDMLVEDIELNCKRKKLPDHHLFFLQERVQSRIMDKSFDTRTPLVHVYDMLHSFALSMKLDVLFIQTSRFIKFYHYECFLSIDKYMPGSYFVVSYWRNLSKPNASRNSQAYSVCVYLESVLDSGVTELALQLKHVPTLPATHTIKGDMSIKQLLATTIQSRINHIIKRIQRELSCLVSAPIQCQDFPQTLVIPLLSPCHDSEKLRLYVDTQTGNIVINLSCADSSEVPALTALRDTLNEDQPDASIKSRLSRIAAHFNSIRLWLGLRRVKHTLIHHQSPIQMHTHLSLWTDEKDISKKVSQLTKKNPYHLFVRTLPNSNNFLLIIPECSCNYELRYRTYFLITRSCNSSGQFIDLSDSASQTKSSLARCQYELWRRPLSIRDFTVYHVLDSEDQCSVLDNVPKQLMEHSFDPQPINLLANRKRRLSRSIFLLQSANQSQDYAIPYKKSHLTINQPCNILLARDLLLLIKKFENIDWINTLLWSLNDSGIHSTEDGGSGLSNIRIVKLPLPCDMNAIAGSKDDLTTKLKSCHLTIQQHCSPRSMLVHWLFSDAILTNESGQSVLFDSLSVDCLADISSGVNRVLHTWHAMCHMYAAWMKTDPGIFDNVNIQLVAFNLRTLRFRYGPNLVYECTVEHKGDGGYSVHLLSLNEFNNPHLIVSEFLCALINKSTSFTKLIQTMQETVEFFTAINSIRSSFSIAQSDKMNSCHSVRNMSVIAQSTHSVLLVYRGQLAIKVTLRAASNCSAQIIRIEDHGRQVINNKTRTLFKPCPAFQIFYTSLQDAFQMDIEEEVWPGMTVSQFTQLIRESPQLGVSPLESYLAGALFFINASYSVLYGSSNKDHGKDSVDSTTSGRILRAHARDHPVQYRSYGFTLALCARRTGVDLSLWRLEFDLNVPEHDEDITDPLLRNQLCSTFKEYFDQKIFAPPFIPSSVVSFMHLLSLPPCALLDIVEVMRWELHPSTCPSLPTALAIRLVMVDCLTAPGQHSLFQKTVSSQSSSSSTKTTHEIQLQFAIGDFRSSHFHSFTVTYNRTFNTVDFQAPVGLFKNAWRFPKEHLRVLCDLSKLNAVKKANQYAGPQNKNVSPILTYIKAVLEANPQIL